MTERKISYGISYLVLTTNIPNSEANVLVLNSFNIKSYGGDGGDDLAELELVEDGGLTSRVETNHEDPHLLLGEEAAEQLREREPHLRSCVDPREPMPPARRSAATTHAKRGNGSDSGGHKRGDRPEIPEHLRCVGTKLNRAEAVKTHPDSSNKFPKSTKLINELRDLAPRIRKPSRLSRSQRRAETPRTGSEKPIVIGSGLTSTKR